MQAPAISSVVLALGNLIQGSRSQSGRLRLCIAASALVLSSCTATSDPDVETGAPETPIAETQQEDTETAEGPDEDSREADGAAGGGDLPGSDTDDGFELRDGCDPETIGDEDGPISAIYEVIDGELGGLCFGEVSPTLEASWQVLASFAPDEVRDKLGVFAGFAPEAGNETGTIAFAGPIDEVDNTNFMMVIDLDLAAEDPEELALTLAHEISHVFTYTPEQLDITTGAVDCDNYFDGYGCFLTDSYVQAWVDEFWPAERLGELPRTGQPDQDLGDELCSTDPSILGAYAASHPEEDFAESFSAFVFGVEVPDVVQPRLDFFLDYPELVEYRNNAEQAGQTDLPNSFVRCG